MSTSMMPTAPMPIMPGTEHRGPLSTALGKTWAPRRRLAERYYELNSSDFDELLRLYTVSEQRRDSWNSTWGENVAMAWSVLQNLVADSFFKNPEPVILPLTTAREEEARMLTDVGRTWHEMAGTENNVMRARILCGLQGGGVIWIEEEAEYTDALALDDDGQPMVNTYAACVECGERRPQHPVSACASCGAAEAIETGEPVVDERGAPEPLYELGEDGEPLKQAMRQEYTQTLLSMHDWRVDPDGRRWDHKDHKWVERRYQRSLHDFVTDPAFSETTKKMLRTWSKSRRWQNRRWAAERDGSETDPSLVMIECGEIWSMVHGKIIHMPVDAEFHLEGATDETRDGFPMPKFWRESRMYPAVLFAYNWNPPDRWGQAGYYPIPDLRLVKSRLKNLNRLEGLILNLCTQQTTKHFYPDGLIDSKVQRRVSSDVPRELIPVDYLGVVKRLADKGVTVPSLEQMIVTLKVEQREQLVKHFEAFDHEVNLIRETLSQGPSQRGGVADSHTATGQLQVGQALERRLDIESERTSSYIDGLTERFFMLLQNRHSDSLPVYYRDSSEAAGGFRPFMMTQEFRELRLSFSHRTGSARGIDRELLRSQIREAITNALPVVQDPVVVQGLLKKLFQTFDDPTLADVFKSDLSQLAEAAAAAVQAVESGAIGLDVAGPQLLEFLNAFVNAHLTQAGIDRVAQQSAGAPPELPSGDQSASIAKPKSAGKRAFDSAAALAGAGRVGGTTGGGAT